MMANILIIIQVFSGPCSFLIAGKEDWKIGKMEILD
jgi:hypothetical protein